MKNGQLKRTEDFLAQSIIDSGWPYNFRSDHIFDTDNSNCQISTETTAWAALALCRRRPALAKQAIQCLISMQNLDGGWSTAPKIGQSDWTSGPAILAIRLVSEYQEETTDKPNIRRVLKQGFDYLIKARIDLYPPVARLLLFIGCGAGSLHYGRGWPWTAGCYNWVEPTAYALMAFKLPVLIDETLAPAVIQYATKYLLDHCCKGGGWNHGAYHSLQSFYPPYVVTTAEVLACLIDLNADPKVNQALDYLSKAAHDQPSAMALAWSILALSAHKYDCSKEIANLLKLQNEDGSFGRSYHTTALSLIALDTINGINPFVQGGKG